MIFFEFQAALCTSSFKKPFSFRIHGFHNPIFNPLFCLFSHKGLQLWCCWRVCLIIFPYSKVKLSVFHKYVTYSLRNFFSSIFSYSRTYFNMYPETMCLFSVTSHMSEGHCHTLYLKLLLHKLFSSFCYQAPWCWISFPTRHAFKVINNHLSVPKSSLLIQRNIEKCSLRWLFKH